MKIYKISQEDADYDEYDSAIVSANSEEEARLIHPDNDGRFGNNTVWIDGKWQEQYKRSDGTMSEFEICSINSWDKPDKIKVEYLFETKEDMPAGLIHNSFRAG